MDRSSPMQETKAAVEPGVLARALQRLTRAARSLHGDRRGGVAIYSALMVTAVIGAGAVAVDVGRLVVLQTQMQNAADAAALSAVTQLDGLSGARSRATTMAQTTVQNASGLSSGGTLPVSSIEFFTQV